jgi:hypothetical protein
MKALSPHPGTVRLAAFYPKIVKSLYPGTRLPVPGYREKYEHTFFLLQLSITRGMSHIEGNAYILHLTYPTKDTNGHLDIPDFLDKEITIDGICYDIVGAVYGDGYHFIFRYYHDGKVPMPFFL